MNTLLEFIKKYYYWFLFIILEAINLVIMFQGNNYHGSVWFTSANTVAGKVNGCYADVIAFIHLKDVNKSLTSENIYLQKQVADLRQILDKRSSTPSANERIIQDSLEDYTLIPAKVVSNSLYKDNNYIIINKGENDGIKTDMGVVGGGGIVGIISLTGPHYSLILPTINSSSNISCRIRHSNYFGYLQWPGGGINTAYLNDIPHYAHVKTGDYIETSGYSSVFPAGLFVGKVTKISNSPDGLSLQLKVNLGTDFSRLTDVCVVSCKNTAEINTLRTRFKQMGSSEQQ